MRKYKKILLGISVLLFLAGFSDYQKWIDIPQLSFSTDLLLMAIAAGISFIYGNSFRWLGTGVFLVGIALIQGWLSFDWENIRLSSEWLLLSGYAMLLLNIR